MVDVTSNELSNIYEKLKKLIIDSSSELGNKIDTLTNKLFETEARVKFLETENKLLSKQVQDSLRDRKKNNIIIFGLEEVEAEDLYDAVLKLFNNSLETLVSKSDINCAYRFGQVNKKRPVVVKFVTLHKKLDLLKKGYLLKNHSISIANDVIKEDREKQKVLRRHYKNAREQGLDAKIRKNNLVVNEVSYSVEELLGLENEDVEQTENKQTEEPGTKTHKPKNVNTAKETAADKDKKTATTSKKKPAEIKSRIIYGLRSGIDKATAAAGSSTETAAGRQLGKK